MKKNSIILIIILFLFTSFSVYAQYDEEPILYFQMEPLDDSLFVLIQENLFIDPPDPKAEIIVDLRDTKNRTIQVKSKLYPLLALPEEIRARVITFPFKINLEDNITYTSVFTDIVDKMKFSKITAPPTKAQITAGTGYINPYLQLFGGERFGIPIKNDIGISLGLGTPYSGPVETDYVEANFHLLGFRMGMFGIIETFTKLKETNKHNNLYGSEGFQVGYVLPFGNFFEISYHKVTTELKDPVVDRYMQDSVAEFGYYPKIMKGSYVNYELRYPVRILGSPRSKFYAAKYLNEWHIGFTGRELTLAGSTFDLRIDAMPHSDVRNPQYLIDIGVQRIMESWGFSSVAIGPTAIFSKTDKGNFGVISMFFNMRLKVGTSF
ncbi:MAG: hypothetical protein H6610_05090 [Ignavibacteriales bacterium]|nr:hypothetical protein [Ignavibacteriales bacterium]MCB9218816.1 hypothetical protein [Ignavibacteriales bacterium]